MHKKIVILAALFAFAVVARAQDNGNAPAPAASQTDNGGGNAGTPGNGGQKGKWRKDHPRRAQVNERLDKNVKDGDMTKAQERRDRREERRMAAKDGGHITKADEHKLNARIDRQKRRDRKEKKEDGK